MDQAIKREEVICGRREPPTVEYTPSPYHAAWLDINRLQNAEPLNQYLPNGNFVAKIFSKNTVFQCGLCWFTLLK